MKQKTDKFEIRIIFSCNEEASVKVTDEKMEAECPQIGRAIANMFGFDRMDAACFENISLNKIILPESVN